MADIWSKVGFSYSKHSFLPLDTEIKRTIVQKNYHCPGFRAGVYQDGFLLALCSIFAIFLNTTDLRKYKLNCEVQKLCIKQRPDQRKIKKID
jgi:hypothetical protein